MKRDALATSRLPVIRSAARVSQLRSFTSSKRCAPRQTTASCLHAFIQCKAKLLQRPVPFVMGAFDTGRPSAGLECDSESTVKVNNKAIGFRHARSK